jgi:Fe-Mn family superoxide dismutase
MAFTVPPLPYGYDALAPHMSAETLHLHHDAHHKAYVDKLNELIAGSDMADKSLEEIVVQSYGKNQDIFNNAGQHYNHTHFWKWMKPNGGGEPPAELRKQIDADFGGWSEFRTEFTKAGVSQFGSGWCWLTSDGGKLKVLKTPNGENPLVAKQGHAILGCDVWEHSYYIDYRNKRADYINAFLDHLVNWDHVMEMMSSAK